MSQTESITNEYLGPRARGHIRLVQEAVANDSDKTLTVTTGKVWEILHIYASLVTSADVGNRQIQLIAADDSANEIYRMNAADVQAANTTNYYHFSPRIAAAAETIATFHTIPLLTTILPGGYTLRIYDSAAIAAAADDLTINMLVIEYEGK